MSDKGFFNKLSDDAKALIKKVANEYKTFKAEFAADPNAGAAGTDPKTNDGELADGTKIKYTGDPTIAEGAALIIVTSDGETPAPDGQYTFKDGTLVTVTGGLVTEVTAPGATTEGDDAEMKAADLKEVKERVTKIVEKFSAYDAKFTAQEDLIKKQKTEIENLKLKLGKVAAKTGENTELLLAFSEVETADPIEIPAPKEKKDKLKFLPTKK